MVDAAPGSGRVRLVVMRHSKAEAAGPTDFERPLADRGHRDAGAAGAWLREMGIAPEVALVSSARRTRETFASVGEAAGWSLAPDHVDALYPAGPEVALDLVGELDARESVPACAVVIGHNPTMGMLANWLDDGEASRDEMSAGFPTSALAVLDFEGTWADVAPGCGRLVAFEVPRG